MSVENYIRSMPKMDLHVQLEGAISKEFILLVAEQTDAASTYKKTREFTNWVDQLHQPDFSKLDEVARETATWVRHPEDIARAVYNLAVDFSKQNIRYAEISVIPALYTDLGMTFHTVLEALNDGADRSARAWGVRFNWILAMPRERPRKSDDIARWATSVTAQKGNVVALSLVGREEEQPIAQFKKAFSMAEKKDLARLTHLHSAEESEDFMHVIETVNPARLHDAWALLDDEEALRYVVDTQIPIVVTPSREVCLGHIKSVAEYPLRQLIDSGVNVLLSTGMPTFYETTLTDEYLAAVLECGLSVDELETIALNTVRAALLETDEKQQILGEFQEAYATLKDEHLLEEAE